MHPEDTSAALSCRAETIRRLARERLGFESLRPGRLEAVDAVLDGRDTLAIMSAGPGRGGDLPDARGPSSWPSATFCAGQ